MKKYIYILYIILCQISISQEIEIITKIPTNLTGEKIVNNYLNKIGGVKNIDKIKTIKKIFKIEHNGVPFNMKGEVSYKVPNLYSSILEMDQVGLIQSTKYDGKNCIIKKHSSKDLSQYDNGNGEEKILKGKLLEEKKKDFFPFPILQQKKNNTQFTIIEIHQSGNNQTYKIQVENNDTQKVFLFFDEKSDLLVKKIISNNQQDVLIDETPSIVRTTEYQNYRTLTEYYFLLGN